MDMTLIINVSTWQHYMAKSFIITASIGYYLPLSLTNTVSVTWHYVAMCPMITESIR